MTAPPAARADAPFVEPGANGDGGQDLPTVAVGSGLNEAPLTPMQDGHRLCPLVCLFAAEIIDVEMGLPRWLRDAIAVTTR